MTICFKNESYVYVDIYIDESLIALSHGQTYIYTGSVNNMPIEIKFSISDKKIRESQDEVNCFNISTCIFLEFDDFSRPCLTIKEETKRFQNHTKYQYLTIDALNADIKNVWHIIDNYESGKMCVPEQKKSNILHIIKKSFIDAILEGSVLSALLAWIFSWKVAVVSLLSVFIIAMLVNSIMLKASNSRHRILNWNRDMELSDDIDYFVNNLEKFCG